MHDRELSLFQDVSAQCRARDTTIGQTDDAPSSRNIASKAERPRVLVVEDERDNRELIADVLKEHGYEVESAVNGAEAYGIICGGYYLEDGRVPHVILLDLMMPIMNGAKFYRLLGMHEVLSAIPVAFITAHEYPEGRKWVASLKKPFRIKDLLETVRAGVAGEFP